MTTWKHGEQTQNRLLSGNSMLTCGQRRRQRVIVFALAGLWVLALAVLVAVWSPGSAPQPGDEPVYNGHPLGYWMFPDRRADSDTSTVDIDPNSLFLSSSYSNGDPDAEFKAAVRAAGTNAIPFLLKWIALPDYRPIQAFGVLGSMAQPAIPELFQMATNQTQTQLAGRAIQALGEIGPPAMPALLTIATNRAFQRRDVAVGMLELMGTNALLLAIPALIECLKDDDPAVLQVALHELRTVRAKEQRVFEAERGVLGSPSPEVRRCALLALAQFGWRSIPDIVRLLDDPDRSVCSTALDMVIDKAPQALTNAAVIQAAAAGLRSSEGDRRLGAAQVLRCAGQQARGQKPDMTFPRSGGWDRVLADATNALQLLAPELLHK